METKSPVTAPSLSSQAREGPPVTPPPEAPPASLGPRALGRIPPRRSQLGAEQRAWMPRPSGSPQATDGLEDRAGDVAVSFKREQEQPGRETLKSQQLSRPPPSWGPSVLLSPLHPTRSGDRPAPTAQGRCLLNTER